MMRLLRCWMILSNGFVLGTRALTTIQHVSHISATSSTFVLSTSRFMTTNEDTSKKPQNEGRASMQMNTNDTTKNPRTRGFFLKRFTGDSTPFEFPVKPIRLVQEWPKDPPFTKADFSRWDPLDDQSFYSFPKLVYHIDEPAVASLTQYYRNNIPKGSDVLDICSSWVSHYPLEFPDTMRKICGTGMNSFELSKNDQLTGGFKQLDLNASPYPELPYDDESFDVVTCVVSIDYLIHPIEVLKEVHRVLRKGGKIIISQSNRCFPTKAVNMWLNMNDRQRLELINGYLQYAGGFVEPRQAFDITATVPNNAYRDPMYIVEAIKE